MKSKKSICDIQNVHSSLLTWYRKSARDLPWRRTCDPYAIWVSEIMLQQTRVDTVLPYYKRFMDRYRDINSLANSEIEEVLIHWSGLGYYRRARSLHKTARIIVAQHGGVFPKDTEILKLLPGIGPYTAGAIASIAFSQNEPAVDGNVIRVLSRIGGVRDNIGGAPARARVQLMARQLAAGRFPGELNQSLMDLGALVCAPRSPKCSLCPVPQDCSAFAKGDQESIPRSSKRSKPRKVRRVVALIMRGGKALTVRRPLEGLFGGLWELPGGELDEVEDCGEGLRRCLLENLGLRVDHAAYIGSFQHVLSHRKLRLSVYRAEVQKGRVRRRGFDAHRWVNPVNIAELPHGAITDKVLRLLQ